jgi:NADPH2:quinone reductase
MCPVHGPPDVVVVEDIPAPEPGPGQVRVRIGAAAVDAATEVVYNNECTALGEQ